MKNKYIIVILMSGLFLAGCMHMGMGMHGKMGMGKSISIKRVQETNKSDKVAQVIEKVVKNLKSQNLSVSNIAVWRIRSQSAGLDVDLLRAKLITELVSMNQFDVISRDRLEELLNEQKLSLSGIMDEKSAVEIGSLIGIDAFVDGYAAFNKNQLSLTLHLIETKTGKILWSMTAHSG
ncbi:MAG: hypothetical protein H8E70_10300 [Candidatus Marinimicrobia bacterium]|nr:hypothetical protein [Candidatus Neomarinimicrobiota bacterium]